MRYLKSIAAIAQIIVTNLFYAPSSPVSFPAWAGQEHKNWEAGKLTERRLYWFSYRNFPLTSCPVHLSITPLTSCYEKEISIPSSLPLYDSYPVTRCCRYTG